MMIDIILFSTATILGCITIGYLTGEFEISSEEPL